MTDREPRGEGTWMAWTAEASHKLDTLLEMHRESKRDIRRIHERIDSHIDDDREAFGECHKSIGKLKSQVNGINLKLNWCAGVVAAIGAVSAAAIGFLSWLIPVSVRERLFK